MATAIKDEIAAPATPNAWPVTQPKMRKGADHVDNHTRCGHDHPWLEIAHSAKRCAHRNKCELQSHGWNEPKQIASGQCRSFGVRAHRIGVSRCHGETDNCEQYARQDRQDLRLVEHQLGLRVVFSTGSVRDDCSRTDAEHLRKGQDDEGKISGNTDGGDGLRAEAAYPVKINQEIQRLKDHRDEHEARGLEEMTSNGAGSQVVHAWTLPFNRQSLSSYS